MGMLPYVRSSQRSCSRPSSLAVQFHSHPMSFRRHLNCHFHFVDSPVVVVAPNKSMGRHAWASCHLEEIHKIHPWPAEAVGSYSNSLLSQNTSEPSTQLREQDKTVNKCCTFSLVDLKRHKGGARDGAAMKKRRRERETRREEISYLCGRGQQYAYRVHLQDI